MDTFPDSSPASTARFDRVTESTALLDQLGALDAPELRRLLAYAGQVGIDVLTEVHEDTAGDVTMPYPGPQWVEVAREERAADGRWPAHSFVTLERAA